MSPSADPNPCRKGIGGFWRSLQQQLGELLGRVGEVEPAGGGWAAEASAACALESVASPDGVVQPGEGWTTLVVTPDRGVHAVDGIVTGWHEPAASHLQMLTAIAGEDTIERSYAAAVEHGSLWHEFGDSHLILP